MRGAPLLCVLANCPFRRRGVRLSWYLGGASRCRPVAELPTEGPLLQVTRRDGEDSEQLLRRFNKLIQRDGVLQEARRRRHFISNREKQRQAERRAARRRRRSKIQ